MNVSRHHVFQIFALDIVWPRHWPLYRTTAPTSGPSQSSPDLERSPRRHVRCWQRGSSTPGSAAPPGRDRLLTKSFETLRKMPYPCASHDETELYAAWEGLIKKGLTPTPIVPHPASTAAGCGCLEAREQSSVERKP